MDYPDPLSLQPLSQFRTKANRCHVQVVGEGPEVLIDPCPVLWVRKQVRHEGFSAVGMKNQHQRFAAIPINEWHPPQQAQLRRKEVQEGQQQNGNYLSILQKRYRPNHASTSNPPLTTLQQPGLGDVLNTRKGTLSTRINPLGGKAC